MQYGKTIAAISTPYGVGGISIIRVSGEHAIEMTDKIFRSSSGKKLVHVKTHTIHHGFITDENGKTIDEVLVSVMRTPHTYTGEDIAEINCHGGLTATKTVLEQIYRAGATPASAGEYTKRAFLNGRMDLCKAEAVLDIINSKTSLMHEVSVNQLEGRLSEKINAIREKLLMLLANVQVLIDYPDEELEPLDDAEFLAVLKAVKTQTDTLLRSADSGLLLKDGIPTAIVGKPNVGKSSLLNLLSGEERAIVTDIAGTTRDAIEESVSFGDITLKIADTAGIRTTEDVIESIGVQRSLDYIQKSKLILFVTDGQISLEPIDLSIMEKLNAENTIVLINKTENGCQLDEALLTSRFDKVIPFSVREEKGITALEAAIKALFEIGAIENDRQAVITNVRHKDALSKAGKSVESAIAAIEAGIPPDTTFIDIQEAISALGEIVGLTVSEEVVDKIFHRFCVGK